MDIVNDMLVGARSAPSPNKGGTLSPKFLVMHYTAGYTAQSAIDQFSDSDKDVSAHITVDRDATVYQHVPFDVVAWHAGPSSYAGYTGLNSHAIGIELVNIGFLRKLDDGRFMDAYGNTVTSERVGPVVMARNARVGSGDLYWPLYPDVQLAKVREIATALRAKYNLIDVVSHEEIDTRGWKTDPGPAFPMQSFKEIFQARVSAPTPTLPNLPRPAPAGTLYYQVTAPTLNIRKGPGSGFDIRGTLKVGARVADLGRSGEWVRITEDSWVHGAYLRRIA